MDNVGGLVEAAPDAVLDRVTERDRDMLQAPQAPQETIELLGLLNDDGDLESLFEEIDWQGVTRRQMYHGIFGRLPESAEVAATPEGFSARDHARDALTCAEFQEGIVERVLRAFPQKRRLVFVHVPKCAGTDLTEHLGVRYPRLYGDLGKPQWISGTTFFLYLRHIARQLPSSDSIFVSGHVPLNWYLSRQLCRFEDRFFTVVRDPMHIMISQVNYVFKRFFEAPKCQQADSRDWADYLGISIFDRNTPRDELIQMGLRALRDPRIVPANYICSYLGDGTKESAMDAIGRCNMEITEVSRYNRWLRERWEIDSDTHANKSMPILKPEHISADDRAYMESMCQEDMEVYGHITRQLDRTGRNSVFGCELFQAKG